MPSPNHIPRSPVEGRLREKYAAVFGEPTATGNRAWL